MDSTAVTSVRTLSGGPAATNGSNRLQVAVLVFAWGFPPSGSGCGDVQPEGIGEDEKKGRLRPSFFHHLCECGRLDENLVRQTFLPTSGGRGRRTGHNQAPSRHPRHIVFARPLIGADCNAPKQTEDRARGLVQLRVFRPLDQNGSEHQAKEITLLQGEIKIGETHSAERITPGRAPLHRCCEFSEPFCGDERKKMLLVSKMAIRGCSGHSGAAGRLTQAHSLWAGFIQDGPRRRVQGVREIARVIP
jgi:hypothetical protein